MTRDAQEHAIHLTAPQVRSDATSVWPAIGGFGVLFLVAGLVIGWLVSLVGFLLGVVAVVGVVRELSREHAARSDLAPDARERDDDWWLSHSKHAWLAIGIAAADVMTFVAIFRAFSAHALFVPDVWPEVARELLGAPALLMTAALVGALVSSIWGVRATQQQGSQAVLRLSLAMAAGALFLGALLWEWTDLAAVGFVPWSSAAGSGYYALTGWMGFNVLAATVFVAVMTWRTSQDQFSNGRHSPMRGIVPFWTFLVVMWFVVLIVMYLRLIVWEGRFLI